MTDLQTIQFEPLRGTDMWQHALESDAEINREAAGQWTIGSATVEFYSYGDRYKAACHECNEIPCTHIVQTGMEAITKGVDLPSAGQADAGTQEAADESADETGQAGQPITKDAPQAAEPVQQTDGGTTVENGSASAVPDDALGEALEDPDPRGVDTDPLQWIPDQFIDQIDGTPAINKKGFSVLCQHYGISVDVEKTVGPIDTDFEYAECRAIAKTPDGEEYTAFGSAHTGRGDDRSMLLEYADTRAFKRAASRATGTGMLAVEELQGGN